MENSKQKKIFVSFVVIIILLFIGTLALSFVFLSDYSKPVSVKTADKDTRNYHIIITGSYENQLFLQQVYKGANRYSDQYNSVVELYVPGSQAEDVPLQELLDYTAFVNCDGIIAYYDSSDSNIIVPQRTDNSRIPLITTGFYNPNIHQVSFIGTSYWELGRKIGNEIISYLHGKGNAIIFNQESQTSVNSSTLENSIQDTLRIYKSINYTIESEIKPIDSPLNINLIVCLTEEDTIHVAQKLLEDPNYEIGKIGFIGFGTNETCRLYLEKGVVSELIDVNPEKIGETGIRELFEFRNKGYANSYVAADVQILRSEK